MAKDNVTEALAIFEEIENEHLSELRNHFIALYRAVECNICFCIRRTDVEQAEKRLELLYNYIVECEYESHNTDIAMINYHRCVVLYDKAKKFYEKKDFNNSKKACKKSIDCGEEAIAISDKLFENKDALHSQCFNQIGSCYFRLSEIYKVTNKEKVLECFEQQYKYKKMSLDIRKKIYGRYNRYTANAYDYMARAMLDLYRWQNEPLPETCHEYVDNAIKIFEYVLGKYSAPYARALQAKIYILEYEKKFDEALKFAEKQNDIFAAAPNVVKEEKEKAENLLKRVIEEIKQPK